MTDQQRLEDAYACRELFNRVLKGVSVEKT